MRQDELATLYDYNCWANARILNAAAGLNDAQFCTPQLPDLESIRAILVHTYGAEWLWRNRCQGDSPASMPQAEEFADFGALHSAWQTEEETMRSFVTALDDARLASEVSYSNLRGKAMAAPLWQILTHVIIHGTQHRAEAALILTSLGRSPGDIDFIFFGREQQAKQNP
jgi:uncharacterized damage-inducible protein DinB